MVEEDSSGGGPESTGGGGPGGAALLANSPVESLPKKPKDMLSKRSDNGK